MTLDEMESEHVERVPLPLQLIDDYREVSFTPEGDPGFGTAAYDTAFGMEITSLTMGICPQCGELVERNTWMNLQCPDETLYYDCTFSASHKYLILRKDQNDPR